MISKDFLELAKKLVQGTNDASRRRAISTAYYAVFHEFAEVLTTSLLGFRQPPNGVHRLDDWLRVYRAFGHDKLATATKQLADERQRSHLDYGHQLVLLSASLAKLKANRHSADYDPRYDVSFFNIAESVIEDAETVFWLLDSYFRHDLLDDGLARSLALDALGIRTRQ